MSLLISLLIPSETKTYSTGVDDLSMFRSVQIQYGLLEADYNSS